MLVYSDANTIDEIVNATDADSIATYDKMRLGEYDTDLKGRISRYQSENGLKDTGYMDPNTEIRYELLRGY